MSSKQDQLTEIRAACQDLYKRTNHLWRGLEGTLPTWGHKYSILYGPPVHRPPLFFLGANPGGNEDQVTETTWPDTLDYADENASYGLAKFIREAFDRAERMGVLRKSVGANLLFFRSKELAKAPDGKGWGNNPLKIRRLLEKWCRREVDRLIEMMDPGMLFLMGKGVFEQIVPPPYSHVLAPTGRWLAARGEVNGRQAIGIRHPTGCWWTAKEERHLSDYLKIHLTP